MADKPVISDESRIDESDHNTGCAAPGPGVAAARASLPLPDPYPDYLTCPHCGELEVEIWCYQSRARCHACGEWIEHKTPDCLGSSPVCRAYLSINQAATEQAPPAAPDRE